MIGRYAHDAVALQSSPAALRRLGWLLTSLDADTAYTLHHPTVARAAPYDGFLTALHMRRQPGFVHIDREETLLTITGAREKLQVLADNIAWLADNAARSPLGEPQDHLHLEYYPEHFFLSSSSMPLVLSVGAVPH